MPQYNGMFYHRVWYRTWKGTEITDAIIVTEDENTEKHIGNDKGGDRVLSPRLPEICCISDSDDGGHFATVYSCCD